MHHHHELEEEEQVLKVGQPAPEFGNIQSYHNGEFHKVSLNDYRCKWLVLFF